jgi:hypothetical protein
MQDAEKVDLEANMKAELDPSDYESSDLITLTEEPLNSSKRFWIIFIIRGTTTKRYARYSALQPPGTANEIYESISDFQFLATGRYCTHA